LLPILVLVEQGLGETGDTDKTPKERDDGNGTKIREVEYTTHLRHYLHTDCEGNADEIQV